MDVLHDRRRGGGGERDPRHPRPRHGPQLAELEVVGPGGNCIKIGLPGKLILSKRKGLREVLFT